MEFEISHLFSTRWQKEHTYAITYLNYWFFAVLCG
jgi:hypothetical protein